MVLLLKIESDIVTKIEDGTVTKNRTVIKWRNQKAALLLKIESDTVTKNRRWYCYLK